MLTLMRKLLRSKLGFVVFALVILAMAGWGVTDVFSGGLGNNLVGAGDRRISDQAFDAKVESLLANQTDDRGRSLTKEQALEAGLIDRIFQQEQAAITQRAYADKVGLTATNKAIQETLTSTPMFQDTTGVFDPNQYRALLSNNGLTPAAYQDDIEASLTINRLQGLSTAGLVVPSALARMEAAFTNEARKAAWFTITRDALPPVGEPTDEDLRALYEERGNLLRDPERRRISLIQLSPDDFTSQATVTEADIEALYEAYKAERYTGPDTRVFTEFQFTDEVMARAALGRIAGGATNESLEGLVNVSERTGRADAIANERLSEQVFSGTAATGGIYGPQPIGDTWSVIRLEQIIPGEVTPLESVRDGIENEFAREQAVAVYYDSLPRFDDLIGTGASLEAIAQDLGVPVLSFAAIDAQGFAEDGTRYRPLISAPDLITKIFDRPVGGTTERFGDDEVTWMGRVDEILPERMPEFEEVRDVLVEGWKQGQEAEQLQSVAAEIELRIQSGETTLAQEAEKYGTVVQTDPRAMTRATFQSSMPPSLAPSLFNARDVGEILTSQIGPGTLAVMEVTEIDRPEPETLDLLSASAATTMRGQLADDIYQAFFIEIQKDTDLEVNLGAFNAYKNNLVADQ
ncbi:MAG: peptidyl-prolyl cis-trans isomerase [Henriciella sp.]